MHGGWRTAKKGRETESETIGREGNVDEGKQSTATGWGFVTVGGVGFKGGFGVGCADSSTLSSAPRSTGGYASLHTFTIHAHACQPFVYQQTHTHTQTLSRLYIHTCATTHPFFSSRLAFGSSSSPTRACTYAHHRVLASATGSPRLSCALCSSLFVALTGARWPPRVRALAVTLCSFVSACTSAESEAPTRTRSRASLRRRLVHPNRQAASFARSHARLRVASMTVRWKIKPGDHDRRRGCTRESFMLR